MKTIKKTFSVIFALVLALSMFAVCASAEGTASGDESMTVSILTDKAIYEAGDTVKVSVSIQNNYNATTVRFPILYDKEVFEVPLGFTVTTVNSSAQAGKAESNTKYEMEGIDNDALGCILLQWAPTISNKTVGCINFPDGEVCCTFNLKVKASAVGKTGTIYIPETSDLFYYQAIQDPTDATTIYYMNAETCSLTFVPANVEIAGSDVDLVPNDDYASTAVVDGDKLIVTGLAQNLDTATLSQFVKATTGGTLKYTPASLGYGTGTKIEVQVSGETVKTYTVVVYGDVNGDSFANSTDLSEVINAAANLTTITDEFIILAADLQRDYRVDSLDLSIFVNVASNLTVIDQVNPYGA